jgi:tRNA pseudouridine38-40 synthase
MMPCLRNFKLTLAYDGSGFHGWQTQAGQTSVQETVELTLQKILKHEVRVVASGRTDTGVHALGQVISFQTPSTIPEMGLQRAMNSMLPPGISVMEVKAVGMDFHARRMARSKTYLYLMDTAQVMSPLLFRYALHLPGGLDIDAMDRAARMLEGEHDFSSFMGAGSAVRTTIRTILESRVFTKGSKVFFFIKGSGFLRHMVRNIVGTLIPIGKGKMTPADMARIVDLKDRGKAGDTAPPQGLYLVGVEYGEEGLSSPDDE